MSILGLWAFPDHLPSLQDLERLCFLSTTLQPFRALLGGLGTQGRRTNTERMQLWAMRLDLRDLQRHLRFQVKPGHPRPRGKEDWLAHPVIPCSECVRV